LPSNAWAQPPRLASTDDPGRRDDSLIRIVPRNRRRAYDVRALLAHVVDRGSLFEMARHYGPSLVTAVARRDGYYPAVGVLANDPRQAGGALTAAASEKLAELVDLCDTFHEPVVNFVDQPDNSDGISFGIDSDDTDSTAESYRGTIRFTKP
jgi:acetyl-CoA carboxylase carboxyltransferase component